MHYPNLTFHGVEVIPLGFNTLHHCIYGGGPEAKSREAAISGALLPDYGQTAPYRLSSGSNRSGGGGGLLASCRAIGNFESWTDCRLHLIRRTINVAAVAK